MTTETNSRASSPLAISSAAVELTDEPAQQAFLELACRGNDELCARDQEPTPQRGGWPDRSGRGVVTARTTAEQIR